MCYNTLSKYNNYNMSKVWRIGDFQVAIVSLQVEINQNCYKNMNFFF